MFHALGLIEQWGSGVQRMVAACKEAGLAAPQFEEVALRFRVTLFTGRATAPVAEGVDSAIMAALANVDGLSTSQIAAGMLPSTFPSTHCCRRRTVARHSIRAPC